ncbi:LacI family DNA-binding transcriptional regulator [Pararhizobium sp. BT-229]|uniref:LacI family DNA-binding transcriptional regulator n=1 Tax=Pararhizobium sp. BT-229 TaxID=2986923 RepID=UPI0021F73725|nr:LacI family DNA-binding transcriptional regulator [Pararhizobium sp. BT-229]MCV9966100.1 LacI family DNA-binding transcriptional regulator [Pararhizobium sp. BT-229]
MTKGHVKLADVAKAAGVSQGTASNVFSRPEVVREEVRERVLAMARELGYSGPDMKGRLLRAGRVNAIGVATVDPLAYFFEDPWARALMTEIGAVCDATGTGIALVSAQNQQKLAWNINSALVDGFILLCVEGGERLVELTRQRQLPYIALALGSGDATIPAIGIDNIAGAAAAARHLAGLGHRRFAILAIGLDGEDGQPVTPELALGALKSTSRERALGYWQALADFGIGRDDVPIYAAENGKGSVTSALEALFAKPAPPTAILAMSDRVALRAMEWLAEHGFNVPGDVSVVGFDGVPEAATVRPGLTTVAQPLREIARRAVDAILEDTASERQEMLDVTLIVRGSTAPPR